MTNQKAPGSKESLAPNSLAFSPSPELLKVREYIVQEFSNVDVGSDRYESEKDKKILEWTINEIWKTCGKLPPEKLKKLISSIKKVMSERNIYQDKIETELRIKRDELKKEVEEELKKESLSTKALN